MIQKLPNNILKVSIPKRKSISEISKPIYRQMIDMLKPNGAGLLVINENCDPIGVKRSFRATALRMGLRDQGLRLKLRLSEDGLGVLVRKEVIEKAQVSPNGSITALFKSIIS